MSERMDEAVFRVLYWRQVDDGEDAQAVANEAARARASEDAKDKEIERLKTTCANLTSVAASQRGMIETRDAEIERLKADNAALLGLIIGMEEGDADEMMRAKIVIRNRGEHSGSSLLEELTRLRAQVATLQNERPSLAVGSQGEPSSETPGRE